MRRERNGENGERTREKGVEEKKKSRGGVKTNDVDPSLFFLYALIPVRVIREHCDLLSVKRKSASERIQCSRGH